MNKTQRNTLVLDINTSKIEKQLIDLRILLNVLSHTTAEINTFISSLNHYITFCEGVATTDANGVCTFTFEAEFSFSFEELTSALRTHNLNIHLFSLADLKTQQG